MEGAMVGEDTGDLVDTAVEPLSLVSNMTTTTMTAIITAVTKIPTAIISRLLTLPHLPVSWTSLKSGLISRLGFFLRLVPAGVLVEVR